MLHVCRPRKDSPSLEESNAEEVRQRECLQKIQNYRLVREIMQEQQKKQRRRRKEMTRLQMDVYDKMQVGGDEELLVRAETVRSICRLLPPPLLKHQILNLSRVSPSSLQATRLQEGMRFSEALKRKSQVATDKKTTEKVQKEKSAAGQLPKKHGKKK